MVEVLNKEYVLVDVDSIREHPQNPRKGDEYSVSQSIASNRFYGACVVQKSTGYVIVGNHRFRGFKAAGGKQVPVIFVDVDDKKAVQILLADNRVRDLAKGAVDEEKLLSNLEQLSGAGVGLLGTGYVDATLKRLREESEAVPPPPEDDEVKLGGSVSCVVVLGPMRFEITKASYDAWIARKMRENSFSVKAVARSVRADLGLGES